MQPINYSVDKKITLRINISGGLSGWGGVGEASGGQYSTGLSAQTATGPPRSGRSGFVYIAEGV